MTPSLYHLTWAVWKSINIYVSLQIAIVNYNDDDDDSCPISECLLCARNCVKCCKYIIYLILRIPQQSCYYFLFTVKGLCLRKIPPLAQGYKAS